MVKLHCVVPGCQKTSVSLHIIPKKEEDRKKWLQFILDGQEVTITSKSRVCSAHFTEDCFLNVGQHSMGLADKLVLKPGAIPSLPVDLLSLNYLNAKWDQLGVDLQGPFPATLNGQRFILTVMDYYTKWVEAYPLKTDSATEVALYLRNLICQLGPPHRFLSQMERTFIGAVNHALGLHLAVEDCSLVVFHPETCTLDPVTQSYINRMVSTLVKDHHRDWDLQLPASLFALRCTIHPSTGKSPFFMLYSKKPRKVFSTAAQAPPFGEDRRINRILGTQEQSTDPSRADMHEFVPLQDPRGLCTVQCERCGLWGGISQGSEGKSDRPLQGRTVDNTYTCAACRAETESIIIKQEEEDRKGTITPLSVGNSLQLFLQHDLIQTVRIKEEIKEEPE